MSSASRLSELASIISENTKKLEEYLASINHPLPSLDPGAPLALMLPEEITVYQETALDAATELRALLLGPIGILQYQAEHNLLIGLQAINKFKLYDFPPGEERTFAQLADQSGVDEDFVRRMIRQAKTSYIFKEPKPGVVAHSAASSAIGMVPLLSQWLGMVSEELYPAASRSIDAQIKWPGSQEPNQTGFNIAHNTDEPTYKAISADPRRAQQFADAMTLFQHSPGMEPSYFVNNYDWSGVSKVVDIGGSHGIVMQELASKVPTIECVVQDVAKVVEEGKTQVPKEISDRVVFMEHDFFTPQPVKGADVYFLRWIFHNWSDKYCIDILRNLVPALQKGARIIVNEFCVPPPGVLTPFQEKPLRSFDLVMLELFNAKERGGEEWAALFHAADEHFVFKGVQFPKGSKLAIIEACWEGEDSS
ncbi:S-adenosyl-L-methionine-dependent methyltransferase [Mollisia scopiformis]|uniref:S-adenosyl-L-methionine-dependent methyltransferase n=1 Tax=Mollisia scopiformis TaxID=149040 RepID=A0A132B499_MOLSC|nr:S-adenosyl-L-methionine-dependent methyltransferase [Mollisia scopiformis]KUJ07238.1 S-adenosyl-L-methionine-dependent methyltransferase [Mollisia scopiformis]